MLLFVHHSCYYTLCKIISAEITLLMSRFKSPQFTDTVQENGSFSTYTIFTTLLVSWDTSKVIKIVYLVKLWFPDHAFELIKSIGMVTLPGFRGFISSQ